MTVLLAWRMLFHSANGFARFVTWVSFIGLTLGVMVLTVVVTVMNGFDHELKSRLLRTVPHITLAGAAGDQSVEQYVNNTFGLLNGSAVFAYFQGAGAITGRGAAHPVGLYGVPAVQTGRLRESLGTLQSGSLDDFARDPTGIILGAPLARALGATTGAGVVIVVAGQESGQVRPRVLKFTLAGTFLLGAEPDYTMGFVNLARFTPMEWSEIGEMGMQIQLVDPLRAGQGAAELAEVFQHYTVSSWQRTYGELFQAVQLEKSMMFLLLLLVVAIAAFNIVAGQSMLVNEKIRSIAILRTLGCTQALIRNAFLLQGLSISVAGTLLGLLLGLGVAFQINELLAGLEQLTGMHLLDGSFFVSVPVKVLPEDLATISALSVVLCMLSASVPAVRAALLDPVEGLH